MKIKINDISRDGITVEEKKDASQLDLSRDDLKFITPVSLTAFISRDKDEVYAHVTASGKLEAVCSRCLSVYGIDFKKDFDTSYDVRGKTTLDLTDDIRAEIVLEYPIRHLCKESCKGLCQVCGKNLNEDSCGHKTDAQRWNKKEKGSVPLA